jgi:diguanylate cyclase (GGDEF)-like protein
MASSQQVPNPATPTIDVGDSQIMRLLEPAAKCRVLIVDDDELVVKRLASLLELNGYEVHEARSGQQALRVLESTVCQIVLTDWHMPDLDGLALCTSLRQRKSDTYIFILMLTVRDGRDDILAGLSAGADDYVVKGATSDEILARVAVGRRITHLDRSLRTSNQENRRLSVTDALTGAHNRRFMTKYLPRELERSRQSSAPLAVVCCDIDHFKGVNDRFGHEAGDDVLQQFVTRAGSCIRQGTDWIARSGGEEFVVVLPGTNLEGASRVAELVRSSLVVQPISTSAGPVEITVSMGAAALESAQELSEVTVARLLHAADAGLYASKRAGRNRVTAVSVPLPTAGAESSPE